MMFTVNDSGCSMATWAMLAGEGTDVPYNSEDELTKVREYGKMKKSCIMVVEI